MQPPRHVRPMLRGSEADLASATIRPSPGRTTAADDGDGGPGDRDHLRRRAAVAGGPRPGQVLDLHNWKPRCPIPARGSSTPPPRCSSPHWTTYSIDPWFRREPGAQRGRVQHARPRAVPRPLGRATRTRFGAVHPGGMMAAWLPGKPVRPRRARRRVAVPARFEATKHHVLATLRADGSPRVSGTEVQFHGVRPTMGMCPGPVKARDLQHDPRFALHSNPGDSTHGRAATPRSRASPARLTAAPELGRRSPTRCTRRPGRSTCSTSTWPRWCSPRSTPTATAWSSSRGVPTRASAASSAPEPGGPGYQSWSV